jgi:hypothetical protein
VVKESALRTGDLSSLASPSSSPVSSSIFLPSLTWRRKSNGNGRPRPARRAAGRDSKERVLS